MFFFFHNVLSSQMNVNSLEEKKIMFFFPNVLSSQVNDS